jgi:hypothetical protein
VFQAVLLDAIFWGGLISSLVVLCDFFFSSRLKQKIERAFIAIWNWLDDIRELKALRRFQRSEANLRLIAILHVVYMIGVLLGGAALGLSGLVIAGTIAGALVSLILSSKMRSLFVWMTTPPSLVGYLLRMLIVGVPAGLITAAGAVLIVVLLAVSGALTEVLLRSDFFAYRTDALAFGQYAEAAFSVLDIAAITCIGGFITIQIYYWGICLSYIIVIGILTVVIFSSRFLFLKLAEYPKGPLLAISVLATAIVAFAKLFVP